MRKKISFILLVLTILLLASKAIAATPAERVKYAKTIEECYLTSGVDIYVRAIGNNKTTLSLRYILLGRPMMYQTVNDEFFMNTLKETGFKKIHFTNGRNYEWTCPIE